MSALARSSLSALLLAAAGCGWRAGLDVPADASAVGVEVFETRREVLERGLEPLLCDEISRAMIDLVGAPVETPGQADLVIRGRILDYHRRPGIHNASNQLVETGLYVAASAELVERRTGRVVVPTREAHVWAGYSTEDSVANEAAARQRALRRVAESLVLELFRPAAEAPEAAVPAVPAGSAAPK